ncbi:GL17310 [Drosophila persimilis]|uniref:GL17310 n=1 Tax=Drosophila persimilis TaxID=7234 RepID=B4GGA7_DROPE|nr:GL17310 [Drosophila persimilis]
MNVENLKTPPTQLRNLVKHVNKRNFNETSEQINQFIKDHGLEADRSSLRYLFTAINFSDPSPTVTVQLQAKLLGGQLQRQLQSSSFVSNICFAFDQHFANSQKSLKPSETAELIGQVCRLTGINKLCECVFALAVTHSSHPELRESARDCLRGSITELLDSYLGNNNSSSATSGLQDISIDLLQYLLCCLKIYVTPKLHEQFLIKLREEFPRQAVPLILAPFLYGSTTAATSNPVRANASETDAEAEATTTTEIETASSSISPSTSSNSCGTDALNEVGIEDIYDHLSEIIFTNQVGTRIEGTLFHPMP